jgi:flagellar hook assembly protein FlgD
VQNRVVVKLALALLVLLAFPGIARAADVTVVARDVPLAGRALQAATPPMRFNLVGVHWQGSGTVAYSARRVGGGWTPWAQADADSGPDARSSEARRTRAWHDGGLTWTGAADRIRFRTTGTVRRLRAYYLWSPVADEPARSLAAAGRPELVSRFGWQADEKIVRAKPRYAPAVRYAIVHHTVNANGYTRAQAPAIVRGIERYHVLGNGWNDIGYNFLIDRFGTVYEGRAGGTDRPVIGAHSLGFNTGSVGIALIGTYSRAAPTAAQRAALVKLLAWRLDVAHVDPLSFVSVRSAGNSRFRAGAPVRLRAISGHRDTYFTDCPGAVLYRQLPAIAKAVAKTGLPKIYAPLAEVVEPGIVHFTAQLSAAAPWAVTVRNRAGAVVATKTGSGAKVDWTWDGSAAPKGAYGWTIGVPGALAATGSLGGAVAPAPQQLLSEAASAPAVVAPAADGSGGAARLTYTLAAAAQVTIELRNGGGTTLAPLFDGRLEAGTQSFDWDASSFPDGRYRLVVTARSDGGATATARLDVVVDRTLTALAAPQAISPNDDGVLDTATFTFGLAASVPLRLEIRRESSLVTTVFAGQLGPGAQTLTWNGTDASGARLPDGSYRAVVTVTDALGEVATSLPLQIDTVAPVLTLVDPARLLFTLSEPATLTLLINGLPASKVEPAGAVHVPAPKAGVQTLTAQAADAAGNLSAQVASP